MDGAIVPDRVERWDIAEVALTGPQDGNPFLDVRLGAQFKYKNRVVEVDGFYDGEGVYRIRFMPDQVGAWGYVTESNRPELDGKTGELVCVEPSPGNHGPVVVHNTYHFACADGTQYAPIGTTCYAWVHQGDALEEQTLETLQDAPFNKMRMCVFPKDYTFNKNEPVYYPFVRAESGEFDYTRFDPAFWRHFELRVGQLRDLGIEADLILFHPYDRWGFATMDAEADDRYLRYIVARLAAYRNVWWSMANEYDLMREKTMSDWDRFFKIVQESDPYQHLRSVHNCRRFYDHGKPWVTHCSVQSSELHRTREWRETYRRPVVVDECCYEGNIELNWGNISARELVHRFWVGTVGGGYVGHGETYLHPEDILWWSKGGTLYGQSPARIAFLRDILEQGPAEGLDPVVHTWRSRAAGKEGEYYVFYFGVHQPAEWAFDMPEGRYQVEVIDPWEMTITPVEGVFEAKFEVQLPGKPYLAARVRKEGLAWQKRWGMGMMHLRSDERTKADSAADQRERLPVPRKVEYLTAETERGRAAIQEVMRHSYSEDVSRTPAKWARVRVADDVPVSFILVDPERQMDFPGGDVRYAFICDVATREDRRREGHFLALMEHVFASLREASIPLVLTHGRYPLYRRFGFDVFTHHCGIFVTPEQIERTLEGQGSGLESAQKLLVVEDHSGLWDDLLLVTGVKVGTLLEGKAVLQAAAAISQERDKARILFEHPTAPSYGSRYPIYPTTETLLTALAQACGGQVCIQGADPEGGSIPDADWIKVLDATGLMKSVLDCLDSSGLALPEGKIGFDTDAGAVTIESLGNKAVARDGVESDATVVKWPSAALAQLVTGYRSAEVLGAVHDTVLSSEALALLQALFPRRWRFSRNESWTFRT